MQPNVHSPPSSAHHRRIELQSPQDLIYLQSLGTHAAQTRLTTAFPPASSTPKGEGEDDELRSRVNQLVTEFLDRTYTGVRENCTAADVSLASDALPDEPGNEEEEAEFEEFDGQTADRIRELERKREKALLRVAALRKNGVGRAVAEWKDQWEKNRVPDDVKVEEGEVPVPVEKVELVDVEVLRRWDEVQRAHGKAINGLAGLKSGLAGTIGKLEEARRVGEELEGKR